MCIGFVLRCCKLKVSLLHKVGPRQYFTQPRARGVGSVLSKVHCSINTTLSGLNSEMSLSSEKKGRMIAFCRYITQGFMSVFFLWPSKEKENLILLNSCTHYILYECIFLMCSNVFCVSAPFFSLLLQSVDVVDLL